MATPAKKIGTAKTNNKSNSKKTLTGKAESVKAATAAQMPAKIVEKPKRTEADGYTEKKTTIKTAETVAQEAKRQTKKSADKKSVKASNGRAKQSAKTYKGLDAQTLVKMYRTMYQ